MRLVAAVLVLVGSFVPSAALYAAGDPSDLARKAVIVVGNPTLRASLDRIYQHSDLWRAALDGAAPTGRRIVVVTTDQVVVSDSQRGAALRAFEADLLAEVSVIAGDGSRVDAILVAVNLQLLDESHRKLGLPWSNRDADLDRILIHEVYGHALPYILAGDTSGHCADPSAGEPAAGACAIRRENAVRAELGLGQRVDSGLLSLALSRGF